MLFLARKWEKHVSLNGILSSESRHLARDRRFDKVFSWKFSRTENFVPSERRTLHDLERVISDESSKRGLYIVARYEALSHRGFRIQVLAALEKAEEELDIYTARAVIG
jgi:hypothetical protein